jgi:hypothetical protein
MPLVLISGLQERLPRHSVGLQMIYASQNMKREYYLVMTGLAKKTVGVSTTEERRVKET